MPGSKSSMNRSLIMAALTKGAVSLINPLYCEDTLAMMDCLKTLGIEIITSEDKLIVNNDITAIKAKNFDLFVKDSGTTARFLLALLCIIPGEKIVQGNQRLNERPIQDLVDGLRELGANITYCKKEKELPIKIHSSFLAGNTIHLRGDKSSQFCSAILLIAPYLSKGCTIHLTTPLISKSYVAMTLSCIQEWGAKISEQSNCYQVFAGNYKKKEYFIEGDYSSAGYFFAIAALTKTTIKVENLSPTSQQPDKKFLKILEQMGSKITYEKNSVCIQGNGVCPLEIDMEECPDQVMTMAVLAAFAKGTTVIHGVRSLHFKESDRILVLKTELGKMGIKTEDTYNTLKIYGGTPRPTTIATYHDHRIAMSFAVAKMCLPTLTIENPEVVKKTFPNFWEILRSL